jgi:carbon-monoxide dehydrogenase medium subunit
MWPKNEGKKNMTPELEYHRPVGISEAIALKGTLGDDAAYWAGGTDLVLQIKSGKRRVDHCIDLTALTELSHIAERENHLHIGALTTLADLERATGRNPHLRTLARVAKLMCTVQSRTLATLGGNLGNASPAADLIPPLVAMSAVAILQGPSGQREMLVEDLMVSPGRTALLAGELIREIIVPINPQPTASAYRRVDRTIVDIALVSAASSITLDDRGTIATAHVALGAVAPRVIRSAKAEAMLVGCSLADLDDKFLAEIGTAASTDTNPISDVRASADYRKAMIKVLVQRTLKACQDDLQEYSK